jgi:hypothetical protein
MPRSHPHRHPPLAGDPICSPYDALAVVAMAIHRPLEDETIAFFVDHAGCSNTITVVSGTAEPDAVLSVAECLAMAASGSASLCGVILTTVRPDACGPLPGDVARWSEAATITDAHGIELIEWFVIDRSGVACPRQLAGDPSRW